MSRSYKIHLTVAVALYTSRFRQYMAVLYPNQAINVILKIVILLIFMRYIAELEFIG